MTEPTSSQSQDVAAGASTITVASTNAQDHEVPTVCLKLRKPKTGRKVQWTSGTVDNEHLNKKKSKSCCIYHKPKEFDESSSSSSSDEDIASAKDDRNNPVQNDVATQTVTSCCIYKKPKEFGESSSDEDSDEECDHCKGHTEKKGQKATEEDIINVLPPHINGGDPPHSQ